MSQSLAPPNLLTSTHFLPITNCSQGLPAHLKNHQPYDQQQCLSPVATASLPVSLQSPFGQPTYRPWQAELQQPILHHIDAGIWLAWPENVVTLAEPLEDHVPAELQKEWLLEVAQHPVGWGKERRRRNAGQISTQLCSPSLYPDTDRTFFSM